MKNIKLFLTDIDGVWTDGGMYYDNQGNEMKKFNTSDSAGVLFLRSMNIPVGMITGEDTEIVRRRAQKLKIDMLYMGVKNKLAIMKMICEEKQLEFSEVAYIGDDLIDIPVMDVVGLSAVPADTPDYVSVHADWVLKKRGGEGVFREFVERYLSGRGLLDEAIDKYLKMIQGLKS